jgi:hypothetical protein
MAGFTAESILGVIKGEAGFKNDDKEVKLYGNFNIDQNENKLEVGFTKRGNDQRREYTPIVNLNTDYKVDGNIVVETRNSLVKYTFNNLRITPPGQKPFSLSGDITRDTNKVNADLKFAHDNKNGKLKGAVEVSPENVLFDVTVTSNFHEQSNGRVLFSYKRTGGKSDSSVSN